MPKTPKSKLYSLLVVVKSLSKPCQLQTVLSSPHVDLDVQGDAHYPTIPSEFHKTASEQQVDEKSELHSNLPLIKNNFLVAYAQYRNT